MHFPSSLLKKMLILPLLLLFLFLFTVHSPAESSAPAAVHLSDVPAARESGSHSAETAPALALSEVLFHHLVAACAEGLACQEADLLPELGTILNTSSPFRFLSGMRNLQLHHPAKTHSDTARLDHLIEFLLRLSTAQRAGLLSHTVSLPDISGFHVLVRGPVTLTPADMPVEEGASGPFHIESLGIGTVLTSLQAPSGRIFWQAARNGRLTLCSLRTEAENPAGYKVIGTFSQPVSSGETGVYSLQDLQGGSDERHPHTEMTHEQIIPFLGLNGRFPGWRGFMILIGALAGLFICIPLCLCIAAKFPGHRRLPFLICLLLCLYGTAALESEIAYWLYPGPPHWRLLFKLIGALCLLILVPLRQGSRFRARGTSFLPLALGLAADIVISVNFTVGVICFLLFHLSLIVLLQHSARMCWQKWLLWAVLSAAVSATLVILFLERLGPPVLAVAVYAPVLILTGFSVLGQRLPLRLSAAFFLFSDLLLGLFVAFGRHPVVHAIYMFLFVLALLILALDHSPELSVSPPEKPT